MVSIRDNNVAFLAYNITYIWAFKHKTWAEYGSFKDSHPFNAFPASSQLPKQRKDTHKSQQNQKRNKTEKTYPKYVYDSCLMYLTFN